MKSLDNLLRAAIADRRLVSFTFHGLPRVGEPHDYGLRVLEERFARTRPAPTGRHKKWDQLYASVSTRE